MRRSHRGYGASPRQKGLPDKPNAGRSRVEGQHFKKIKELTNDQNIIRALRGRNHTFYV